MWVNESQLVNLGQWVQLGTVCNANGTGCVNVNNTGFTAMVASLSSPCTVDSTHKANQVVVFSTGSNTQVIPPNGGYWDGGLDLGLGRNNPQMDDNWTDDYSKTTSCPANLMEDSHFALYYNGTLLDEWTNATTQDSQTGGAPCCGGGGAGPMVGLQPLVGNVAAPEVSPVILSSAMRPLSVEIETTVASTSTMTATSVPTVSPTPDTGSLVQSAVAAPNVSNGQQPIRFFLNLNKPAKLVLSILTLTGERVYSTQAQGNQGLNTLLWNVQNNAGSAVASGLYLYYLQVDDGIGPEVRHGKIVIIH